MPRPPFDLTPEQLAKKEERRLKKLDKPVQAHVPPSFLVQADDERGRVLARPWISVNASDDRREQGEQQAKIKTWNLLAQTLVRRKLFPASDCLKSSQREHMLYRDLLYPQADILCLQEVDRLDKVVPFICAAGYDHVYVSGPNKKHGCLIAFDRVKYENVGARVVQYDEEDVRQSNDEHTRHGSTHRTKNIGSIVALMERSQPGRGLVVATTHLFWHPAYSYERTRQSGILLREVARFRLIHGNHWPCIFAGDFNFAPDDPAYALLVGAPLLPTHSLMLARSRVVHASLDQTVPVTTKKMIGEAAVAEEDDGEAGEADAPAAGADDGEDETASPDRMITNARAAGPTDGLLTTQELVALFSEVGASVRSAYDQVQRVRGVSATFGARVGLPAERLGYHEPEWTSYTHYWKTVLDYIFILDPAHAQSEVVGYLQPPTAEELEPGIPMKGVCGSDHVPMCSEIRWVTRGAVELP